MFRFPSQSSILDEARKEIEKRLNKTKRVLKFQDYIIIVCWACKEDSIKSWKQHVKKIRQRYQNKIKRSQEKVILGSFPGIPIPSYQANGENHEWKLKFVFIASKNQPSTADLKLPLVVLLMSSDYKE
jgi:hypothetical protein